MNAGKLILQSGLCAGIAMAIAGLAGSADAQTVQPVIVEAKDHADGKLEVTNTTLAPMIVVLEPKSFDISESGEGRYRPLDPGIHVELSAMSVRLQPKQSYYVFYRARADKLPAWFTIYATFAAVQRTDSLNVRFMLPHTVYLYQKQPLAQRDLKMMAANYLSRSQKVVCDLENFSAELGRAQEVRAVSRHAAETAAGFPMLPGATRHVEVAWKNKEPPERLEVRFEHFTLQEPVPAVDK